MMTPRKLSLTARRLEEVREETRDQQGKPLSQEAFAKRARVSRQAYQLWLKGRTPSGDSLRQIAEQFGVSADWLLGIEGAPKSRLHNAADPSENALADRIARAVSARLAVEEDVLPGDFEIDLAKLLDWIGEDIARKLRPWLQSERHDLALRQNAAGLQYLLSELERLHEKGVPENGLALYRKMIANADRRAEIIWVSIVQFLDVPGIGLAERERRRMRAAGEALAARIVQGRVLTPEALVSSAPLAKRKPSKRARH